MEAERPYTSSRRRSDRVSIAFPVEISGIDASGRDVIVGHGGHCDVRLDPDGPATQPVPDVVLRFAGTHWLAVDQSHRGLFLDGVRMSTIDIRDGQTIAIGDPQHGPRLRFQVATAAAARELAQRRPLSVVEVELEHVPAGPLLDGEPPGRFPGTVAVDPRSHFRNHVHRGTDPQAAADTHKDRIEIGVQERRRVVDPDRRAVDREPVAHEP